MLGAIVGDIIGSIYEKNNIKSKDFPLFQDQSCFTDDTVLTVAIAELILNKGKNLVATDYIEQFKSYFNRYPNAGYGGSFKKWAASNNPQPYSSWGNGSAMRVSPISFAFNDIDSVLLAAKHSAEVTHNHPEGIKGAQATASVIFLARIGQNKTVIKDYIETNFAYNLSQSLDEIRENYSFDVSCQGSVPQAIIAFLESTDFEDAIRNAISLGGDSDTIACISGGIAHAFYRKVPEVISEQALKYLDSNLRSVTEKFLNQYQI